GFSVEFAEHREYAPGDDLKHVDWKVFGKTDRVYLKQYEEETNLIGYLVLDVSESMAYQSGQSAVGSRQHKSRKPLADSRQPLGLSKLEYAQTAAAALAYLILQQQDSVGLATFDREVRQVIRPSSNAQTLNQLIAAIEEYGGAGKTFEKTATGPTFHDLAERFTRRGVVVILSDLFDDPEPMLSGLKHFRSRRHDVVVMHVMDPAEIDFDFHQPTLFKGLEAAGDLLVEPARLRSAYQEEVKAFLKQVATGCRAQGADYLLLRTDQPMDAVLSRWLAHRQRQVQ
ncbi:MAG: DUF58 domain-containing protein, partial [Planctomycetota bacterium]